MCCGAGEETVSKLAEVLERLAAVDALDKPDLIAALRESKEQVTGLIARGRVAGAQINRLAKEAK